MGDDDHFLFCFVDIALFSALEQTHCANVACGSEMVTVAFYNAFWIFTSVGYLQRCLIVTWMVPHETAAVSAHVLCTPYNHAPCHVTTMHHVTLLHAKPYMYGACVFSCNLPPALLAEWLGSFTCYCGNTERYRKTSQHREFTLEENKLLKIIPRLLPRLEPATFWSRVRGSTHWATPLPKPVLPQ